MASVKYTAFVNEVKGKISGTVFKGGYAGSCVQSNTSKWIGDSGWKLTKADAGRFASPLSVLSSVSSNWKGLTDPQRLSWESAAPNFPFKNRFGETYTPSGFQLYVSCNCNLEGVDMPPISSAPINVEPEPPMEPFPGGLVGGYYWDWYEWIQANELRLVVSMAGPFTKGKRPTKSSYSRIYVGIVPADETINLYPHAQLTKGSFGNGGMVYFKWELIDTVTGLLVKTMYTSGENIAP